MGRNWDAPDRIDIEAQASARAYGWNGPIVYSAIGECPVPLTDTSEQAVHLWVNKVTIVGHDKGVHYAPSALRLFIGTFGYEYGTDDYKKIVKHIGSSLPKNDFEPEPELADPGDSLQGALLGREEVEEPEAEEPDWLQPVVRKPTIGKVGKDFQQGGEEIELQ